MSTEEQPTTPTKGEAMSAEREQCIAELRAMAETLGEADREASLRPDTGPVAKTLGFFDGIKASIMVLEANASAGVVSGA